MIDLDALELEASQCANDPDDSITMGADVLAALVRVVRAALAAEEYIDPYREMEPQSREAGEDLGKALDPFRPSPTDIPHQFPVDPHG